ncbi:MAG: O-antigen ligase family protein [Anaerorhabdus sp.]
MKKIFTEKRWELLVIFFIVIQPIIDLDYLIYNQLDKLGLPRIATVVRFLGLPLLCIWGYFQKSKNKKKTLILSVLYGVVFLIYFILHNQQAAYLRDVMGFSTNFKYSPIKELIYLATLILPFGLMYCVTLLKPSENLIKKLAVAMSLLVALPIFVSNLLIFGYCTYGGDAFANIFSWFSPYTFEARLLATKFFFAEGNTIGILMFIVLPLLYLFFVKAKENKEKILFGLLIIMHSFAMLMLGTRVATFGAILIPAYFIVVYLIDVAIKNQKFLLLNMIFPLVVVAIVSVILPYTPAVVNQKINTAKDVPLIADSSSNSKAITKAKIEGEALVPGSFEFDQFYIYMFEQYGIKAGYINTVSKEYYTYWYHYTYDPKFWVDLIEMDVYDRINGRQVQKIFMDYKLSALKPYEHILGAGYSTFMTGSIILEKDFIQQFLTLGIAGFSLTLLPWLILALLFIYKMFRGFKKYFNIEIIIYGSSLLMGFGVGYTSGHTMDQMLTSVWLAFICGILLNKLVLKDE